MTHAPTAYALSTHPLPPLSRVLLRLTLLTVTWEMRRRLARIWAG